MNNFFLKTLSVALTAGFILPSFGYAAVTPELQGLFESRADLQAAFAGPNYQAVEGSAAGFLIDLNDWAGQYGWKSHPELSSYAPRVAPVRLVGQADPAPTVSSMNYIVIDDTSGEILAANRAELSWPIASITKLMTVKVALDSGLDSYGIGSVENIDNVGGARLWVEGGTTFSMRDLLYATLVGSANNAANAVARETGISKADFVERMNTGATIMNLGRTHFADPTGIEVDNVSTAREVAYLAHEVFQQENIRRMTGTWRTHIEALNDDEYVRDIKNTNWLLYDSAYDDLYVTAGKTGYLDESKWNLVVRMHPMGESEDKSVLIVLMGADGRRESFDDAHSLAHWAWDNYDWDREELNIASE
jgi:D-alanyl-D-alanine carboxypeptidase